MTDLTADPITRAQPLDSALTDVQQVLVSPRIGGGEQIAIELASVVKHRGVSSRAWVPGVGPASTALDARGIPWTNYGLEKLQGGGVGQLSALLAMGWLLRRSGHSVIHVHNPIVYGFLRPMLRFAGVGAIAHFHIEPTRDEVLWALRHPPAVVVTCARYIAAQIASVTEAAGHRVDVVAIPNAIDMERFPSADRRAAKRRLGAPEDRWLMLMLANLSEHKGQLTAVRTVRHLIDRGIAMECWFAGEERGGEQLFTERLRTCARELEVADFIRFLGFRSDGGDLLQAADFLLLPSTHEGLPLSILEAQAAGAIALGAPIPGIREVVEDAVTGFLVPADDSQGYAARIEQMIRDPERSHRIATAARAQVEAEHTWPRYVERIWQVYTEVARRRRR